MFRNFSNYFQTQLVPKDENIGERRPLFPSCFWTSRQSVLKCSIMSLSLKYVTEWIVWWTYLKKALRNLFWVYIHSRILLVTFNLNKNLNFAVCKNNWNPAYIYFRMSQCNQLSFRKKGMNVCHHFLDIRSNSGERLGNSLGISRILHKQRAATGWTINCFNLDKGLNRTSRRLVWDGTLFQTFPRVKQPVISGMK